MKLTVLLPFEVLLEERVRKIVAEAENGSFCLLPRHVDFVAALVPGILSFEAESGEEFFLAVDEGILVKRGEEVTVSTRNGVRARELGELRRTVDEEFRKLSEMERKSRSAVARLEADFVRRFMELQSRGD